MSLLQVRPRILRILKAPRRAGKGSAGLWVIAILGLEIVGPWSDSDLGDALGGIVLLSLIIATELWHRQARLAWVDAIHRAFRGAWRWVEERWVVTGIDFRGAPALPRRLPALTIICGLVMGSGVVCLWLMSDFMPGALRVVLAPYCYTGYLAVLVTLWSLLIVGTVGSLLLAYMLMHDFLVHRYVGVSPRPLGREVGGFVGYSLMVLSAVVVLPSWIPSALLLTLLPLLLLSYACPGVPRFLLAWRGKRAGPGLEAASFKWLNGLQFTSIFLFLLGLILASRGTPILREHPDAALAMPITSALGVLFAWSVGGGMTVCVVSVWRELYLGLRFHRAARARPVVQISGKSSRRQRRKLRRALRRRGWRVRYSRHEGSRGEGEPAGIRRDFSALPLEVWNELDDDSVYRQWTRCLEIQHRRRLIRRLERLFKRTSRRRFHHGHGFWIGLHHWFIRGLARDHEEEEFDTTLDTFVSGNVGPSFDRLFDWPSREHFRVMMRALDLDLIFVEDGVGFRRLRRVLRMLFEIYDIHGGRQRAEDKFLKGLPGLRTIIHDVGLESSLLAPGYPEPDYEDIGRARILHIFKDRGADAEPISSPADQDLVPASA